MKFSTKNIAYLAILTAISALLNALGDLLTIPNTNTQIAFTYLPTFVAGFYFGPGGGFLVGVIGDLIGWIMRSSGGAWSPIIALSSGLMGVIPGLVRYLHLHEKWTIVISYLTIFLVCSVAINTTHNWLVYSKGRTYWAYFVLKVPLSFIVMLINLVLNYALMPFFKRLIAPRINRVKSSE